MRAGLLAQVCFPGRERMSVLEGTESVAELPWAATFGKDESNKQRTPIVLDTPGPMRVLCPSPHVERTGFL